MPPSPALESIINAAYCEGCTRFGDVGLNLQIYTARIHSIVRKHLGTSPSESATIDFVKSLHGGDLYLATACAQHSPGMMNGNSAATSAEHASVAWRTLEKTYKGFICDLVR